MLVSIDNSRKICVLVLAGYRRLFDFQVMALVAVSKAFGRLSIATLNLCSLSHLIVSAKLPNRIGQFIQRKCSEASANPMDAIVIP